MRWTLRILVAIFPLMACAQNVPYMDDVNAVKGTMTPSSMSDALSNAQKDFPGFGKTQDISSLTATSPEDVKNKALDNLTYCKMTPEEKMTPDRKAECLAAVTAAQLTNDITVGGMPTTSSLRSESGFISGATSTAKAAGGNPAVMGAAMPTFVKTDYQCASETKKIGAPKGMNACNIGYSYLSETCEESLVLNVKTEINNETGEEFISEIKEKWTEECKPLEEETKSSASGRQCEFDGEICVDGPGIKKFGKHEIFRQCWRRKKGFTCYYINDPPDESKCQELESYASSAACTRAGTTCVQNAVGLCVSWDKKYNCHLGPEQEVQFKNCGASKTCIGDHCFDTSSKSGREDFYGAIAGMEAAREGGVYLGSGTGGQFELFRGEMGRCTRPKGPMSGIEKNCCFQKEGAETNASIVRQGGGSPVSSLLLNLAGSTITSNLSSIGSHYMYDFFWESGIDFFADKAITAWQSGSWSSISSFTDLLVAPSLSIYGFTLSTTAPTFLSSSTMTLAQGIGGTSYNLYFNPYVFAAMVAFQIYQQLQTCSEDEIMLALRRGKGLCVYNSSYCSRRLPKPLKTCTQETERWCCWNGRLAKHIALQGKCQLFGDCAGNAGSGCQGFTADQFQQLDFSKMDLSEFMSEIELATSRFEMPGPATMTPLRDMVGQDAVNSAKTGLGSASKIK